MLTSNVQLFEQVENVGHVLFFCMFAFGKSEIVAFSWTVPKREIYHGKTCLNCYTVWS